MQEQLEKIYYLLCSEIIKNIREHGLSQRAVLAVDRAIALSREIREYMESEQESVCDDEWNEALEKVFGDPLSEQDTDEDAEEDEVEDDEGGDDLLQN